MAKNLNKAIVLVFLMILTPISGMNLTSSDLSSEDSSMKSSAIVGNGIDNPIEIDSTKQLTLNFSKEDAGSSWGSETEEIWFTADTTTNLTNITVRIYWPSLNFYLPSNSVSVLGYNARDSCGFSATQYTNYAEQTTTLLCENPSTVSKIMFMVRLYIPQDYHFDYYGSNDTLQAILDVEVTEGITEEEPVDDTPLYMSNYQWDDAYLVTDSTQNYPIRIDEIEFDKEYKFSGTYSDMYDTDFVFIPLEQTYPIRMNISVDNGMNNNNFNSYASNCISGITQYSNSSGSSCIRGPSGVTYSIYDNTSILNSEYGYIGYHGFDYWYYWNLNSSELMGLFPMQWNLTISFEQLIPEEWNNYGDAPSGSSGIPSTEIVPEQENTIINGFLSRGGIWSENNSVSISSYSDLSDSYYVKTDHNADVFIEFVSDSEYFSIANTFDSYFPMTNPLGSNCEYTGFNSKPDGTLGLNYTSQNGGEFRGEIECDSWKIQDILYLDARLSYYGNNNQYSSSWSNTANYSIEVISLPKSQTISHMKDGWSDENEMECLVDCDAQKYDPIDLNLGYNNGSFVYSSDTEDWYYLNVEDEEEMAVSFYSQCSSFLGTYGYRSMTYQSDTLIQIETEHVSIPSEIISPCEYTIFVEKVEEEESEGFVFTDESIELGKTVVIPQFYDSFMSNYENYNIETFNFVLPLDLFPTDTALLRVEQASGKDVRIQLEYSYSGINQIIIGQQLHEANVNILENVRLTGLDGSEVTITMTEKTIDLSTSEETVIRSNGVGFGVLGPSADEGMDLGDTWSLNYSSEENPYNHVWHSFKLSPSISNVDVRLGNGMSTQSCVRTHYSQIPIEEYSPFYSSYIPSQTVYLQQGRGTYQLETKSLEFMSNNTAYYISDCPSFTISSASNVMSNSTIVVDTMAYIQSTQQSFRENVVPQYRLYDSDYNLVYNSSFVEFDNMEAIIEIPEIEGAEHYFLLLEDAETGAVLTQKTIYVNNNPTWSVARASSSLLAPGESPSLSIDAKDITGYPLDWEFYNLTWNVVSSDLHQEIIYSENLDDSFDGLGSSIIDLDLPSYSLNQGESIQLSGIFEVNQTTHEINQNWIYAVKTASLDCSNVVISDSEERICNVNFFAGSNGNSASKGWEGDNQGELIIYNQLNIEIERIAFESDEEELSLRLSTSDWPERDERQTYYAKLEFEDEFVANCRPDCYSTFFIDPVQNTTIEVDESEIGNFQISLAPLNPNALAGDSVEVAWSTSGENVSSITFSLFGSDSRTYIKETILIADEGQSEGIYEIELPNVEETDFSLYAIAYSIYGTTANDMYFFSDYVSPSETYLQIYPTTPIRGEEFEATIIIDNDENWIGWTYELSLDGEIISTGEGYADDNTETVSILLPRKDYPSNWFDLIFVIQQEDGTTFTESSSFFTAPDRKVVVDSSDEVVVDKPYLIDWLVEGEYVNSADSIKTIFVSFTVLGEGTPEFTEIILADSLSGYFSVKLPEGTSPGTHTMRIQFEHVNGDTTVHTQYVNVKQGGSNNDNSEGLFGIDSSTILGLDTLLILILVIHAVVIQMKISSGKKDDSDEISIDQSNSVEEVQFVEDQVAGYTPYVANEYNPQTTVVQDFSLDDVSETFYERTEHPAGSGVWWERNGPTDEWRQI